MLEAIQPADVPAPLVRREWFGRDLLLRDGEAGCEAVSFGIRCSTP
jgi:hypothetical protein